MMKKTILLSMLALSAMGMNAQENTISCNDSTVVEHHLMTPIQPSYLSNSHSSYGWDSNWFIEAKGGASAFIGTPTGCGDLFDRTMPVFQLGVGKWFTPSVGGRIGFQGFQFKNANLEKMDYQFVHADFMYNLTSSFMQDEDGVSRLDVIPYAGVGMIHNSDWKRICECPGSVSSTHPFAFSYGVQVRYHIQKRMYLLAELSGMSTLRNFDVVSTSSKFGDNMINVSAGLSFTLGKVGTKKVIDARPYILQNNYLMNLYETRNVSNEIRNAVNTGESKYNVQLSLRNNYSGLNSLRKRMAAKNMDILNSTDKDENEGNMSVSDSSWDKSAPALADSASINGKGNYSGLNSLHSKLKNKNAKQQMNGDNNSVNESGHPHSDIASSDTIGIGTPVYFYFRINSHTLIDTTQSSYLDELARIAKESGKTVTVAGAADSATGTKQINERLSKARASFVAAELIKRGVSESQIKTICLGGISEFSPIAANRYSRVIIE